VKVGIDPGSICMMSSMFTGTEDASGEVVLFQGRSYKSYRGMGSLGAMAEGSADRYFQDSSNHVDKRVPEGIEDFRAPQGHAMLKVWMSHGDKVLLGLSGGGRFFGRRRPRLNLV